MFQAFQQHFYPHFEAMRILSLNELFAQQKDRYEHYQIPAPGLTLDFCRQPVNQESLRLLHEFCEQINLRQRIQAMFQGEKINVTEQRAVLHVALRASDTAPPLIVEGMNVTQRIQAELHKMAEMVSRLQEQQWFGASGKAITDIVNLGIGGSDLGPRMVARALKPYHFNKLKVHFVANVDGTDLFETLSGLNPETTLFIVASKSFTTQETLLNAKTAKAWLAEAMPNQDLSAHFIGITSQKKKAINWGILPQHLFEMWDFVGGRYSLWSSIGLPIAIQVGMTHFKALLKGAELMDQHFLNAPWQENLPVIMAFLALMNQNFYGAQSHAVIPYAQLLELLPAYLQQADMESNGKSISQQGELVTYQTGVALWGGVGTNGQHAFHQLLHQGTLRIPVDFILPLQASHPYPEHQEVLIANCLAQAEALRQGQSIRSTEAELTRMGYSEAEAKNLAPHKYIPGNRPANIIFMQDLKPENLGALIAGYEHKILTQSIFWDINAFDQWGVELGKALAGPILAKIKASSFNVISTLTKALEQDV